MSKADELKKQTGNFVDGDYPLDDYSVIAMGLEIESDLKVRFWRNVCGEPFFTLTFSDGSQSVYNARGAYLPHNQSSRHHPAANRPPG